MFSFFANRTQNMAFAPYKTRLARAAAASHAGETLAAYLQGLERAYAVNWALKELEALFGEGAKIPIALIRAGMASEDEDFRASNFDQAMQMIAKPVRGDAH